PNSLRMRSSNPGLPYQMISNIDCSMKTKAIALAAIALLAALNAARAEDAANYPAQSIKIIVPFPAGGTADTLPRLVADKLRQKWNQTIIIENRSGAGGNIGAEAVASSTADGYTLLASPPGPIAINQTTYRKLSCN